MMVRIPEPELMDDEAQARAYAEADFDAPHNMFVDLMAARIGELSGNALDLGCGPGDIVRRVAQRFGEVRIEGVEGAGAMVARACRMVSDYDLDERVRIRHLYLPSDALATQGYDIIFSNGLLHHPNDPMVLWASVLRCAKPGARVFVMDLLRPPNRMTAQALVDEYAAAEPEVLRNDFFNSLLAAYQLDEVRHQLAQAGLGSLHTEQVSDRHWISHGEICAGS